MKNTTALCISYQDIINSDDFYRALSLILDRVPDLNKENIISLFEDNNISLNDQKNMLNFLENQNVQKLSKKLLNKKINVGVNNIEDSSPEKQNFINLMNSLFGNEKGYENISNEIKKQCEDLLALENIEEFNIRLEKNELEELLPQYIKQAICQEAFFSYLPNNIITQLENQIGKIRNYFYGPSSLITIVGTTGVCLYGTNESGNQCTITSNLGIGNITHRKATNIGKFANYPTSNNPDRGFQPEGRLEYEITGEEGIATIYYTREILIQPKLGK